MIRRAQREPDAGEHRLGVLWISSAVAALLLCLTVSGTLSDWTQAILSHQGNTAATTSGAAVLAVTGPDTASATTTCSSSASTTNSSTCSINLFGNNGATQTSMAPGSINQTVVTVKNVGDTTGTLTLDAASCVDSTNGTLCGKLNIAVECVGPTTVLSPAMTLTSFANDANILSVGSLLAGTSSACTFTTTLPLTTTGWSGQTVTQTITWSLKI